MHIFNFNIFSWKIPQVIYCKTYILKSENVLEGAVFPEQSLGVPIYRITNNKLQKISRISRVKFSCKTFSLQLINEVN